MPRRVRLVVATLEHPKQLEEVKEEVDDVEVELDRRHDVIVGAVVVHDHRRVVQDVAREDQRADQLPGACAAARRGVSGGWLGGGGRGKRESEGEGADREDHTPAEAKIEEHVEDTPKDEDDEAGEEAGAEEGEAAGEGEGEGEG